MAAENLLDSSAQFSLRQTAEQAEVSHNAPYRHFKNKEALIHAVLEKTVVDIADKTLKAPLLYGHSLTLQVQYVGRLLLMVASRSPERAHLLFTYRNQKSDETPSTLAAAYLLLRQNLILILGESHELESRTRLDELAVQLLAIWHGLAMMFISKLHSSHTNSVAFFHTEDQLFDLADVMAENTLKSFMR